MLPEQSSSSSTRTPVIHFGPKVSKKDSSKLKFSVNSLIGDKDEPQKTQTKEEPKLHVTIASQELSSTPSIDHSVSKQPPLEVMPSLVPFSAGMYGHSSTGDNLCIDEDYDN